MKNAHLSIFSDASYNCQSHQASYAFCVEIFNKKAQYVNSFPYNVWSSKDAELLALGHALNFLFNHNKLTKCDSTSIYIDNKQAIYEIENESTVLGYCINNMWLKLINKVGSKENFITHIKAHTFKKGDLYENNAWCDKHARIKLRELVNATK